MHLRNTPIILLVALIFIIFSGCTPGNVPTVLVPVVPPSPEPSPSPSLGSVQPTETPDFITIDQLSGHGTGIAGYVPLQPGVIKITWNYIGTDAFEVHLTMVNSGYKQMVVNTTGNTDGQEYFTIDTRGRYRIEVWSGQSEWKISVAYRP